MNNDFILNHIDYTLLKPYSTWPDIQEICENSMKYHTASVCIPASYVKKVKEAYGGKINICTVVGFPLGYSTTAAKAFEAAEALKNGASEIDMVINIGDVKNSDFQKIYDEICVLREITDGFVLKVIIETCYLSEEEKIKLCKIVTDAKADFIKTSTGFGTGGAVLDDILLFKKHIGPNIKIKAAGGIKTINDFEAFINAGCERIGTSSAVNDLFQIKNLQEEC